MLIDVMLIKERVFNKNFSTRNFTQPLYLRKNPRNNNFLGFTMYFLRTISFLFDGLFFNFKLKCLFFVIIFIICIAIDLQRFGFRYGFGY